MAITLTQTVVFNCTTSTEYSDLLAKANAWLVSVPGVVQSVVGASAQKRVTVTTKANPIVFETIP